MTNMTSITSITSITPLKKPPAPPPQLADDYTLRLCEQLARWRYQDLPAAAVRMLKPASNKR